MDCCDFSVLRALGQKRPISRTDEAVQDDLDDLRAEMRHFLIRGLAASIAQPFRLLWRAVHRRPALSNEQ